MKELLILLITTIITLIIWIGMGIKEIQSSPVISPKLLEKAIPINGKIDVEFLKELENPAYE